MREGTKDAREDGRSKGEKGKKEMKRKVN